MKVLTADLTIPGWCSFRIPHSINAHLTYPAPPPTTIYGLIANALGMRQDDYSLLAKIGINVRILEQGEVVETFSRWQKWNPAKDNMYTTLMKQKIIQPAYRIYLSSSDSVLQAIQQALIYPARLLYLGESDDMVEIHGVQMQQAEPIFTKQIVSAVPVEDCQENEVVNRDVSICQWPVRFQEGKRSQYHLTYQLVYLGKEIIFAEPVQCLRLSQTNDVIILRSIHDGEQSEAIS